MNKNNGIRHSSKKPLAGWVIHAAFESPATDYEEDRISLDEYVTQHPEAVFYIRVTGDCMIGSGINDGDLLIVDRSLSPLNGDIIVGVLNGEHLIACLIESKGKKYLVPDNTAYEPVRIEEYTSFTIEGVVPHTLLNQRKQANVRAHRLQQFLRELRKGIPAGTSGQAGGGVKQ